MQVRNVPAADAIGSFRPSSQDDCVSRTAVGFEKGHRGEILPGCEYRKGEECSREGLITRPLRGVVLALG